MPASLSSGNSQSPAPDPGVVAAIPAHNEAARVAAVVRACLAVAAETWVVDDGSTDGTARSASEAGARVLCHETNHGKGMAIRTALSAFEASGREFLVLLDADGQHDPALIPGFLRQARETGAQLVIGDRMRDADAMPPLRRWTNRLMSAVLSRLAGCRAPDSQCGFRLLGRDFVRAFRPTTGRFDLESEMVIQAGRAGFRIESVAIPALYAGGSSHIRALPDAIRFLRLLWRYRRGASPLRSKGIRV